jgi:hypothetical protein
MSENPSSTFALRFISGKYQGGEFPLRPDKDVIIGRSSDLDMVLVEDMVSRKHAKISSAEGQITIQDLGSTNGTFVNGEKIKRVRLREGDRILIGTSIIKLVTSDGTATDTDAFRGGQGGEPPVAPQPRRTVAGARVMAGTIDEVPLPDLLQLLTTSKKSGVLELDHGGTFGRIYLRQGQIYYATINESFELNPLKAVYRMLVWESGAFELQPPDDKEFLDEIDQPTEALLMEAMRQFDELALLKKDLPEPASSLALVKLLLVPLRDLAPEQLDVLQLVHNYGQLSTILDRSHEPDLETCKSLVELLQRKLIVVAES